jgi:NAD(P)H-flavin reductase
MHLYGTSCVALLASLTAKAWFLHLHLPGNTLRRRVSILHYPHSCNEHLQHQNVLNHLLCRNGW